MLFLLIYQRFLALKDNRAQNITDSYIL